MRALVPAVCKSLHYRVLAVAVESGIQGKGLGRLLMESAENNARRKNFDMMTLTVETDNEQAVRFYLKQGWIKSPTGAEWQGMMTKEISRY